MDKRIWRIFLHLSCPQTRRSDWLTFFAQDRVGRGTTSCLFSARLQSAPRNEINYFSSTVVLLPTHKEFRILHEHNILAKIQANRVEIIKSSCSNTMKGKKTMAYVLLISFPGSSMVFRCAAQDQAYTHHHLRMPCCPASVSYPETFLLQGVPLQLDSLGDC